MMEQGETLGILYLDTGTDSAQSIGRPVTEAQERTVKTLTEHLALAVANLNLRETLRTQSIRDPLTGLFNRRYMEESLEREFRRASRKQSPLVVLMVDIDHFKRFNDRGMHRFSSPAQPQQYQGYFGVAASIRSKTASGRSF